MRQAKDLPPAQPGAPEPDRCAATEGDQVVGLIAHRDADRHAHLNDCGEEWAQPVSAAEHARARLSSVV